MNKLYIRSSDHAEMVEVAPHQYVNRKIFRLRERPDDGCRQSDTAVAPAEASAERAAAA